MLVPHRRDELFEFLREMLYHSFVLNTVSETAEDTFAHVEALIEEHRNNSDGRRISRLQQKVPSVGYFFTRLPLREAFRYYDQKYMISKRRWVRPSFNEIRHIANLAQVMAIAKNLQLVSFDGDQTLYTHGHNFTDDELASSIISLLNCGIACALVTAASYGTDAEKYAERMGGLLQRIREVGLEDEKTGRFFVVGGQCSYAFRASGDGKLHHIQDWRLADVEACGEEAISSMLDTAENAMRMAVEDLKLSARVLRKSRSAGIIAAAGKKIPRESLDEIVLRVREDLLHGSKPPTEVPFCCFNGGVDVWCDVGNKAIGCKTLQALINAEAERSLHIGDQFFSNGNDFSSRACCPTSWIVSPEETKYLLRRIFEFREADAAGGGATAQ